MNNDDEKLGKLYLGEDIWNRLTYYQKMCEIAAIREYLSRDYVNMWDILLINAGYNGR